MPCCQWQVVTHLSSQITLCEAKAPLSQWHWTYAKLRHTRSFLFSFFFSLKKFLDHVIRNVYCLIQFLTFFPISIPRFQIEIEIRVFLQEKNHYFSLFIIPSACLVVFDGILPASLFDSLSNCFTFCLFGCVCLHICSLTHVSYVRSRTTIRDRVCSLVGWSVGRSVGPSRKR